MSQKSPSNAALISRVISGLKAIEAFYKTIPQEQISLLITSERFPSATIAPNGEVEVHLTCNARVMELATNHLKLSLSKTHGEISTLFQDVAEALKLLLPGRALLWRISSEDPYRHDLYLGTQKDSSNPIISTIAGRWKTPLTQLTSYFAMSSKAPSESLWLLASNQASETLCFHATDLDDALHQSGFQAGAPSSARKPECKTYDRAMRSVEQFAVTPILQTLDAAASEMGTKIEDMMLSWDAATEAEAADCQAAFDSLDTEESYRYTADLLDGTSRFDVTDNVLVHCEDLAAAQARRCAAVSAFEALIARLMSEVTRVHPSIREARVTMGRTTMTSALRTELGIQLTLDGVVLSLAFSTLSQAILLASHLAIATKPAPWQIFGIATAPTQGHWLSGTRSTFVYMTASCPAHAALIYAYRQKSKDRLNAQTKRNTENLRGHLLEPVRRHEFQAAFIKLRTSIDTIYY